MSYQATVIPVMIASPGDVLEERNIVRDVLHEFNDLSSMQNGAVLLPVGWETHASPSLGERAQGKINRTVLNRCDLLVAAFWTRIGTPTTEAESGTAEEIRKHVEAGKPAMVYFSTAPVAPDALDPVQYRALQEFKSWCYSQGLTEQYDNISDFADKFRRQIQLILRDDVYLSGLLSQNGARENSDDQNSSINKKPVGLPASNKSMSEKKLSNEAQQLLLAAAKDKNGTIISVRYLSGQAIQTNSINFAASNDRRSVARWEAALGQLVDDKLVVEVGVKGEIFEVTDRGYELADLLEQNS